MSTGLILAALLSASSANPQEDAVTAVVMAINKGDDLNAAFPGAISAQELPTLQRLSKCTAHNLMRQRKGDYTVVWVCDRKTELGMEVLLTDNKVTSISTSQLFRRPKLEP
jgi:hypothetical protein